MEAQTLGLELDPERRTGAWTGQQLGTYQLLTLLGAGGMGEVYRARDPRLGRDVAIKVLARRLVNDRDAVSRFRREATAVAALSHPNIVAIHDFGVDRGTCYAVMELLEGETLRTRLTRGPIPWREAAEIAAATADGLAAAHIKGIVHLDIKPENIFLTALGQVKLLDFGIAHIRRVPASSDGATTSTMEHGTLVGTAGYMSPEQVRGDAVHASSDVFALGCVMYEMVTGRGAFTRSSVQETMAAVLRDDPQSLCDTAKQVPPALEHLICRCIAKQSAERFDSAHDLALALRTIASSDPQLVEAQPAPIASLAVANGEPIRVRRRPSWFVRAAVMTAILASIVFWLVAGINPLARFAPSTPEPVPLTSYPGQEVQPNVSPDGNYVAFSWSPDKTENFDIYVKQFGQDKPMRLTTSPARDFSPAWSPDGRAIAFGRLLDVKSSGIFVIPALGGPERKLAESTAPTGFRPRPFVAWSPDGQWLAYSDSDERDGDHAAPTGSTPVSLFLISIVSGERRRLTSHPPDSVGDSGPSFAPDGHALAFVRTQTLAVSDLYLLPLSGAQFPAGEPRRLTSWRVFTNSPSWAPDGRSIIVASGRWGRLRLWRVAEAGTRPPEHLKFLAGNADDPTVSRRGQLVYAQKSTDINIWRTTLSHPGAKAASSAPFLASTMIDGNPQFSPDGKQIVFASDRAGHRELWIAGEDGSNIRQLTSMGAPITGGPRWSPDGSRIAFDSNPDGQFDVYVVNAAGGPAKRLTDNLADEAYGVWSPDSQSIYFMSSRTGQRQIWRMPASGGEAVQMTKNGGVIPFPSPDGAFLYYSERAGEGERNGLGGLRRLRLVDAQDESVLPSVTFWNVAFVREGIYFIPRADSEGHYSVCFYNFRTRQTSPVIGLTGRVSEGLAVSPDGRTLLFTQVDEQRSDLMLIDAFR